jgi:hypothetical protein
VCYCKDCRAYAYHLGKAQAVLDELGGTEVVATQAQYVVFTGGVQNLACMSLSEKGLLRWYAECCHTPIANTPRNWRLPYVGLVHNCLRNGMMPLERSFPRVQMHVNTDSAKGKPPSMQWSQATALLGFMPKLLFAAVVGSYRHTPFFTPSGSPIVAVKVLSSAEREKAMNAA